MLVAIKNYHFGLVAFGGLAPESGCFGFSVGFGAGGDGFGMSLAFGSFALAPASLGLETPKKVLSDAFVTYE
jgi:hypothetical protein